MSRRGGFRANRRTSAGSPAWSPAFLTGLVLWLDADNVSSVATWPDASGKGNNFTQATGGNQLSKNASYANGHAAMVAAGGQYMTLASPNMLAGASAATFFIVGSVGNAVAAYWLGNDTSTRWIDFRSSWQTSQDFDIFTTAAGGATSAWSTASLLTTNQPTVLTASINYAVTTNQAYVYKNGTDATGQHNDLAGNQGSTLLDDAPWILAAQNSTSRFFTGAIANVIVYSRLLSNVEREQVLQYLGARYAITVA